jgi:hypothetical protein
VDRGRLAEDEAVIDQALHGLACKQPQPHQTPLFRNPLPQLCRTASNAQQSSTTSTTT